MLECVGALRGLGKGRPHTYDPLVTVIGQNSDVAVYSFERESQKKCRMGDDLIICPGFQADAIC